MPRFSLAFVLVCSIVAPPVSADAPLEPPASHTVCSLNNSYCAFLNIDTKKTQVWRVAKGTRHRKLQLIWEMPGWFRNVSLSNDGQNLIAANEGGNLLDPGYKPEQVILSFYHHGSKVRDISLKEIAGSPPALEKTESHYRWCQSYGLDENGRYLVNTLDNRKIFFDAATGVERR